MLLDNQLTFQEGYLSQGTQDAVEYANIVLFKQDSIFLQGTTSDSIGRFEFMNLSPNDYVIVSIL